MRSSQAGQRHAFVMIEVVMAVGLMGLLLVGVYAGVQANERLLRHYISQREALDVLDNVVERLASEAPVSPQRCAAVLGDEMAHSPLAARPRVRATCSEASAGGVQCIIRDHQHLLAEVRMGRHEP
jgi:hypothetical protein